jgi:integrase
MLTLNQRGKTWHITGTLRGKRYRESTRTHSRAHAEALLSKRQNEILDRDVFGEKRTALFAEAVVLYVEGGGEARFLRPLLNRWGARRIEEITASEVAQAARDIYPGRTAATLDRQLYTPLNAVLRKAAKASIAEFKVLDRPKVRRNPVTIPDEGWLWAFLPFAKPQLQAIVLFMSFTAARVAEACRLNWSNIDFDRKKALLGITKNGKAREVALAPIVIEALLKLEHGPGNVFGYAARWSVNQAIERACKRAGITYYSSHKIGRHAFAARLLKAGHSTRLVQVAGGWSGIGIVAAHYGHLEQSDVDNAVTSVGAHLTQAGNAEHGVIAPIKRKA